MAFTRTHKVVTSDPANPQDVLVTFPAIGSRPKGSYLIVVQKRARQVSELEWEVEVDWQHEPEADTPHTVEAKQ